MATALIVTRHNSKESAQGLGVAFSGEMEIDPIDPGPSPLDELEHLLDLPQGEKVEADGVDILRRFFEMISQDIRSHNKRGALSVCRRILAIGFRCGALRGFSLQTIAQAAGVSKQALCQAANKTEEELLGQTVGHKLRPPPPKKKQ